MIILIICGHRQSKIDLDLEQKTQCVRNQNVSAVSSRINKGIADRIFEISLFLHAPYAFQQNPTAWAGYGASMK